MKDNGAKYFLDHLGGDEAAPWAASRAQVPSPTSAQQPVPCLQLRARCVPGCCARLYPAINR